MNDEPDNKRPKSTIGTHDGTFHCDEALACFMLKQLPEYKEAEIIRLSMSCDCWFGFHVYQ